MEMRFNEKLLHEDNFLFIVIINEQTGFTINKLTKSLVQVSNSYSNRKSII